MAAYGPVRREGVRAFETVVLGERHRSTDVRPGNDTTPSPSSQYKIVRGPHPGCWRRNSTIRASTAAAI
jgi:hypothetical protein